MNEIKNRGWSVTMAGLGINLALGILYTWSIFKQTIKESVMAKDGVFNWDMASLNDPFAVCCLMFTVAMIFAGRLQDKLSPRLTAVIGGILTGAGLIVISQSNALFAWILGFGVLTGLGLGFGYASATPPAIKWFPSSKTGMIAGIVVAGFGLASVYIAPLANFLIANFGLSRSMLIFGVSFLAVVCILSMFLVNPPDGYVPADAAPTADAAAMPATPAADFAPLQMLKTAAFYKLWFMYFIGAGAALIIIGGVAGMAKKSMGDLAWMVVALMAIGNAGGRIVAGVISDKIGRTKTLLIMMSLQSAIIFTLLFIGESEALLLVAAATMVGFNYGTNLSLFPSVTKDYFGLKNFGINYGLLFSAWGIGGFIFPRVSQMIVARTGSQHTAYLLCSILLAAAAILSLTTEAPGASERKQTVWGQFMEKIAFSSAQPVDVYLGSRHL
ncbi:MAG: OFA family MFS transporter [Desulfosarcina sp.]|nr:OFA family MFS transporter [Desulfosarcina sp.]MBC2743314.1 OFA family MFS transporter [Desulfosarcina sp.]MBC2766224.1 OFA family MFS transporter [Desulfosarcina sp.]